MNSRKSTNNRPGYLIRSWTAALTLGLTTGSVLAGKTHEEVTGARYDNTKAPHESPYKAEPPSGGHENLAAAATNPLANLMQFQFQYQYNFQNYNTDDTSWSGVFQPVIPFKLPWKSVPTLITRTTIPYVNTPSVEGPVVNVPGQGLEQLPGLERSEPWVTRR